MNAILQSLNTNPSGRVTTSVGIFAYPWFTLYRTIRADPDP